MPYKKSTQKKYGENPLKKKGPFKMKGSPSLLRGYSPTTALPTGRGTRKKNVSMYSPQNVTSVDVGGGRTRKQNFNVFSV